MAERFVFEYDDFKDRYVCHDHVIVLNGVQVRSEAHAG